MCTPTTIIPTGAEAPLQHGSGAGIACGDSLKDGAAVGQVQSGAFGPTHQRRGGGVALITADGTAGADHTVQRMQAEMSQLATKTARTLQQAAAC